MANFIVNNNIGELYAPYAFVMFPISNTNRPTILFH